MRIPWNVSVLSIDKLYLKSSMYLSGASNAPSACYEKLNVEAQGFGSCSPQTNLPCRGRE